MRIKIPIIFLCLIVLTSCNLKPYSNIEKFNQHKETALMVKDPIPENFFPREITVVSAGDSLTQGVGDSTEQGGYLPYLEAMLEQDRGIRDAYFYNFGVKGNRSDQLLRKLESTRVKKAIKEADIVILTIGGNDVMKVVRENFAGLKLKAFKQQKKIYEQNLKAALTLIREENPDIMVVLVGLYNPFIKWFANISEIGEIINDWNMKSKDILAQYPETYFVEIDDLFQGNEENLLFTDYFHPNDRGYELIAGRVYETLQTEALNKLSERYYAARSGENEN
ncbi:SGNH/GDSL hydrolase family protein [Bacillus sp. FJAT-29790]|uniref:SGNH/GDSL hydrolase family protein n=1 Tax=Bacillus sp. FJAT-29790 TaxID=1895002 RepID=UPI001C24C029|nr:SGNH/GDSL hydrolase family protein [Bacillus sp. FJAT-29790]MBU8878940.1 SGNH/GDSL hydrolase family protein [Bacillus sp. FJAT-29790]